MEWILSLYIGLAIALAAFAVGITRRRARWVVAGTAVAAPTCLSLALLFWVAPALAVLVIVVASALSAWALRRAGQLLAAMLLLPFGAFVVATALTVPLQTDQDGTSAIGLALGDLETATVIWTSSWPGVTTRLWSTWSFSTMAGDDSNCTV